MLTYQTEPEYPSQDELRSPPLALPLILNDGLADASWSVFEKLLSIAVHTGEDTLLNSPLLGLLLTGKAKKRTGHGH